ncbi:hypothetical protein SCACP_40390 [Sporomusa carbonis]|uniref:hypothetical protein n=1 Tax=Sporomusa carbonis TaxID=3076075 RepID=UPI003A719C8B
MELSLPLDPANYDPIDDLFEDAYKIFVVQLKYQDKRPTLFGKRIFIDSTGTQDGKTRGFWHIASIGADDNKYDMFPCVNDKCNGTCKYKCDVDHCDNILKDDNSVPCLYRANKITWVKELIELATQNKFHPNLRVWEHIDKKTGHKDLLIRYVSEYIDYVLIFKIDRASKNYPYRLKTAFPIVLKSYKYRYDKEYDEFIQKK